MRFSIHIPLVLGAVAGSIVATLTHASAQSAQPSAADRLSAYARHALTHPGNAERGRKLFFEPQRTKCAICHQVGGEGNAVGPDLSKIGGKFDRPHLIESLLEPSRQIVEGYRASLLVMADGQVVTGMIRERNTETLTLVDVEGKSHKHPLSEVEGIHASPVSLMPEGLAELLSVAEFTDLIAFLETLRPGGKPKFGAGTRGPLQLPAGFEVETVATGLTGCTALETTRDGRIFVCEQTGTLRVVKDGRLLDEPFVTLPVDDTWERGLIGVTVHSQFPKTPYVYVCYVAREPFPHHRVSRFTAEGDRAIPGSEKILLQGDDQCQFGGNVPAGHQGGAIHFGRDGQLYIGIGENTAGTPAQDLATLQGKILRIAPDGSIPSDNPFYAETTGKYRAIWALGCRNPFTFAVHPEQGDLLINDVGGKFEEINPGIAGANYGWPTIEHGPTEDSRYVGPVYHYSQASISGGDFSPSADALPARYQGRFFFADFVHGWIRVLSRKAPWEAEEFASGLRRPVDLRFDGEGNLYVLLRNAWVIDDKFAPQTGSLLRIRTASNQPTSTPETRARSGMQFTEDALDASADHLPAYKIETPVATYYLEKSGAGLSSMLDREGKDWLGFHPRPGSGSAGEYRGFPNAVHQQAGNYFHPKNQATDPAKTTVNHVGKDRVTILAEAGNGLWAGRYDFFPTHCTFTMTRMPPDKKYWILYEGTPGGKCDADDWWITFALVKKRPLAENHEQDLDAPEWIAFGDAKCDRVLYLYSYKDDAHPDYFYEMQRNMTVFGFGRAGLRKYLDRVPRSFSIGFLETTDPEEMHQKLTSLMEQANTRVPAR